MPVTVDLTVLLQMRAPSLTTDLPMLRQSARILNFSNVNYDIPAQYNISADSVIFEARVKNTPEWGGAYGYDIVLQLYGENGLAHV